MKDVSFRFLRIAALFIFAPFSAYASGPLRYDGLYTSNGYYLRFYPEGVVIDVLTGHESTLLEAQKIAKWFIVEDKRFAKGRYVINDNKIVFTTMTSLNYWEYSGEILDDALSLSMFYRKTNSRRSRNYKFFKVPLPRATAKTQQALSLVSKEFYEAIWAYRNITRDMRCYDDAKALSKETNLKLSLVKQRVFSDIEIRQIGSGLDELLKHKCKRIVVLNGAGGYVFDGEWSEDYCALDPVGKITGPIGTQYLANKFIEVGIDQGWLERYYYDDIIYEYWRKCG